VLLYQMATGELPFRGATPFELSVEIMVGTPQKLGQLPEPLQSMLRRCLEKDPAARISQVSELADAWEGSARQTGPGPQVPPAREAAEPTTPAAQPAAIPASRRRRVGWAAGAATALYVLLLGGIYARHVWLLRHAVPPVSAFQAPKPSDGKASDGKASVAGNPEVKVWVNTDSGTYHCPGTRWYGRTQVGEYMTQKQAQGKGYHPAAKRACM
jgi:serine/threonine protein kinase